MASPDSSSSGGSATDSGMVGAAGAGSAAASACAARDLLAACDHVRDVDLPALGFSCKDAAGGGAVVSRR